MKNMEIALVAFGGIIGAGARYGLSETIYYPFIATSIANIIGSLIIGVIYGLTRRLKHQGWTWPFFATGLCGGFTTMSTFSMELVLFVENGNLLLAFLSLLFTLFVGILAVLIGHSLAMRTSFTVGDK